MRQGFLGVAARGRRELESPKAWSPSSPPTRREAFMVPVCNQCKQDISSLHPGKPIDHEWQHIPPCPNNFEPLSAAKPGNSINFLRESGMSDSKVFGTGR